MRGITIQDELTLVTEVCCACGITFAMPERFQEQLRRFPGPGGMQFYCPNGHQQHYTGQSDKQRAKELEQRLEQARLRHEALYDRFYASERSKAALKGVITRTKNRIAHGVCPCCRRTFQNLANHMASEHPDYVEGKGHE